MSLSSSTLVDDLTSVTGPDGIYREISGRYDRSRR
jgi:hypothetical protein